MQIRVLQGFLRWLTRSLSLQTFWLGQFCSRISSLRGLSSCLRNRRSDRVVSALFPLWAGQRMWRAVTQCWKLSQGSRKQQTWIIGLPSLNLGKTWFWKGWTNYQKSSRWKKKHALQCPRRVCVGASDRGGGPEFSGTLKSIWTTWTSFWRQTCSCKVSSNFYLPIHYLKAVGR